MRGAITDKARRVRRRRGGEEGATAVEFALVATPLFFMIFSIMELALVYMVSTTLDNAMADASREIRTGEFQAANVGASPEELEAAFIANVCARMSFMEEHCLVNLSVDVRTLTEFNQGGAPSPMQADGSYDDEALGVGMSGEGARVLARAFYRWPLVTPFLGEALDRAEGKAVIEATIIHQNEPFGEIS